MHITEFGVIGVYFIVIFLAIYGLERLRVPNILGFLALGLISQYLGRYLVPLPLTEAFPLIGELAVWLLFFFIGLEYSPEALARMSRSLWKPGLIDFGVNFFCAAAAPLCAGLSLFSGAGTERGSLPQQYGHRSQAPG